MGTTGIGGTFPKDSEGPSNFKTSKSPENLPNLREPKSISPGEPGVFPLNKGGSVNPQFGGEFLGGHPQGRGFFLHREAPPKSGFSTKGNKISPQNFYTTLLGGSNKKIWRSL